MYSCNIIFETRLSTEASPAWRLALSWGKNQFFDASCPAVLQGGKHGGTAAQQSAVLWLPGGTRHLLRPASLHPPQGGLRPAHCPLAQHQVRVSISLVRQFPGFHSWLVGAWLRANGVQCWLFLHYVVQYLSVYAPCCVPLSLTSYVVQYWNISAPCNDVLSLILLHCMLFSIDLYLYTPCYMVLQSLGAIFCGIGMFRRNIMWYFYV
jgi:hypothetical protein